MPEEEHVFETPIINNLPYLMQDVLDDEHLFEILNKIWQIEIYQEQFIIESKGMQYKFSKIRNVENYALINYVE